MPESESSLRPQLNLPNILTASRLVFAAVFVWAFLDVESSGALERNMMIAFVAAALAMISDWADGFVARKLGIGSDFGKLFDPLADAIFFVAAFGVMGWVDIYPLWMAAPFLVRELTQHLYIRPTALRRGVALGAKQIGKYKTGVQAGAVLLTCLMIWQVNAHYWVDLQTTLNVIGTAVVLAGVLSLASIVPYLKTLWQMPKEDPNQEP